MFSIANLLDRARSKAQIVSDYQLAKAIGITHQAMSAYRGGKTLPNAQVIEQLCALSGDDAGIVAAQVEAARAKPGPVRAMWEKVALRLAAGATTAILSVCFAISLIAMPARDARAATVHAYQSAEFSLLYIVSNTFLSVSCFALVRLRQTAFFFRVCWCAVW